MDADERGAGQRRRRPPASDDDDSPQESDDDAALEPPLDVYTWTERDLEVAEGLDADLMADLSRTTSRQRACTGILKGDASAHEYRQQHPEALRCGAHGGSVGEDDDEQTWRILKVGGTLLATTPLMAGPTSHTRHTSSQAAMTRLPTQNVQIYETSVCAKVGYALHLVYARAQDGPSVAPLHYASVAHRSE
ncbi:hypothetical protein B0H10DRAFT_2216039 [Mycena sp. CBHHK59/15]|nr:hypothetical protein B0H10DRAFT_2216039 [Mycena sp. CBHHK59/15]